MAKSFPIKVHEPNFIIIFVLGYTDAYLGKTGKECYAYAPNSLPQRQLEAQ